MKCGFINRLTISAIHSCCYCLCQLHPTRKQIILPIELWISYLDLHQLSTPMMVSIDFSQNVLNECLSCALMFSFTILLASTYASCFLIFSERVLSEIFNMPERHIWVLGCRRSRTKKEKGGIL